jgi:phage gp29-like protein
MGLDDMVNKAKEMAGEHAEAVEGAVDKAAEAVKEKTPDQIDPAVDQAAQAIKDQI